MKKYLSETIEEHKATFDSRNIRDFIDLYIKATKDESAPEIFTGIKNEKKMSDHKSTITDSRPTHGNCEEETQKIESPNTTKVKQPGPMAINHFFHAQLS